MELEEFIINHKLVVYYFDASIESKRIKLYQLGNNELDIQVTYGEDGYEYIITTTDTEHYKKELNEPITLVKLLDKLDKKLKEFKHPIVYLVCKPSPNLIGKKDIIKAFSNKEDADYYVFSNTLGDGLGLVNLEIIEQIVY